MDKFIGKIGDHSLEHDNRQFILSHPAGCPHRCNSNDNGKTFHGYWVLDEALDRCALKPHALLFEQVKGIQRLHEQTKCGRLDLERNGVKK